MKDLFFTAEDAEDFLNCIKKKPEYFTKLSRFSILTLFVSRPAFLCVA